MSEAFHVGRNEKVSGKANKDLVLSIYTCGVVGFSSACSVLIHLDHAT